MVRELVEKSVQDQGMLLLGSILDQLKRVVDYNNATIFKLEDKNLTTLAYRGATLQAEALRSNFSLEPLGDNAGLILRQEPVIISDVQGDTPQARAFQALTRGQLETTLRHMRSWMGIPLVVEERVIGLLGLDHIEPDYYSLRHVELAQDFANRVVVNIENAVLYAETERRADEIQTLLSVQQAITSHLDLDAVLQLIADEARRLTLSRQALVFLLEGDDLCVSVLSGEHDANIFVGYRMPVKASLTGLAVQTGQPFRVLDVQNDPHVNAEAVRRLGTRSLMSVPLVSGGQPIGAIMVTDKFLGTFGPNDERVLTTLAPAAVIGLENARLYREEQKRRREAEQRRQVAEGLRDILTTLNSNRPLDEILDYIVAQAGRLMGADAGAVYRLKEREGPLVIQAARGLPVDQGQDLEIPLGQGGVGQVVLKRRPLVFPDLSLVLSDGDLSSPLRWRAFLAGVAERYRSSLAVPLLIKDEVYGGVELYYSAPREFSVEEVGLVVALADQAALAIETARLYVQADELARLQERQRIAQALHDTVAQILFSIGLETERCISNPSLDGETGQRIQTIRRLVARSSEELRSAIFALHNPDLKGGHGLVQLIQDQVNDFQARSGIAATLIVPSELLSLPSPVGEAVYRTVREALSNVRKHAHASAVVVSLHCDDGVLAVTIQDDGVGLADPLVLEANESSLHFGVATMRQLAAQAHGEFLIANNEDQGVMVKARFPISRGCNT